MIYSKEEIKDNLSTNIKWMERALLVLFNRQTEDEQNTEHTKYQNSRGFNGVDARYLTYVAKYIRKGGHLSGRHIDMVGKRLPKYWGQIQEEIDSKR